MTGPIRSGAVGGVNPVGGPRGDPAKRTGSTLRGIAGRIADRMAREFSIARDDRDSGGSGFQGHEDLYEIAASARKLTGDLGGKPADEGRFARSLGFFAQESASLLAARPEAASLDVIARAIAAREGNEAEENVTGALQQIDHTTRDILDSRPP